MTLLQEAEAVTPGPLHRPARLRGTLRLPSDKSIAHRALMLDAVASGDGVVTVRHPGDDVLSTVSALRSLGASIESVPDGDDEIAFAVTGLGGRGGLRTLDGMTYEATPDLGRLRPGEADCGNSGTTMRLLCGLAAFAEGPVRLTGDRSLSRRPMERIAEPLRLMGARVETTGGHAPVTIHPQYPLADVTYDLPVASAQVLAAVLLAGLGAHGSVWVQSPGPVRDHTERLLSAMGVFVDRKTSDDGSSSAYMDAPGALRPISMTVPGDISSAAAWLVAGTIHPDAEIHIHAVGLNPRRTALIDVLSEMGADVRVQPTGAEGGEPVGDITVRGGRALRAVAIDPARVPALLDELPLIAVAVAAAEGTSEVRGAAELRVKESDRVTTMAAALRATGADIEELPDGWRIRRGVPRDARITTHGDHRIAIAMAVAAFTGVAGDVTLDDPGCVAVSYPTFWRDARILGALPEVAP